MVPFEPSQVSTLIQATLVPVIMISAVGLIALVVQNRHAVVLERAFRINVRRQELREELERLEDSPHSWRTRWARGQMEIQEVLLDQWLTRGTYTRNALVGAFLGVFLFGLTSLSLVFHLLIGLRGVWGLVTVSFFVAGIVAFLICFLFVLIDVYQGLQITRLETRMVNRLLMESKRTHRVSREVSGVSRSA